MTLRKRQPRPRCGGETRGRCVDCGSKESLEHDRIIPVSEGGSSTERNLQLLCESCGRAKGASI